MDHYSQFEMLSVDERKKDLLKYAHTLEKVVKFKPDELDAIVTKIVDETGDYSFTGYAVFGRIQEQKKLESILNET